MSDLREEAEAVISGRPRPGGTVPNFVMQDGMYAQYLLLRDISDQLHLLTEGRS